MFKPKLFNAGVVAASVLIGLAVPSAARASTPEKKLHPVFDVSKLNAHHQELVAETLSEFDYDWDQLRPGLRTIGRKRITIEIKDITKWRAVGLSWPGGKLQIDDVVTDDTWFQDILRHEVGHMVDFFHLAPKRLHDEVSALYGASWDVMGHNFNNGFVEVFSSTPASDPAYPMTTAELQELRLLLGGTLELPVKTLL